MKKLLILAAVMAALIALLASASYTATFGGASDNYGNSSAPQSDVSNQGAPTGTAPGVEDRQQLAITAQNMDTIGQQAEAGTIPEDQLGEALDNEVHVTNQYLVERKIIRQELAPAQLLHLLRKLGYWGGATWGKASVDRALREKLLVGRTDDATSSSNEWKQWLTREEFAVGLMRTLDQAKAYAKAYTDQAIGIHEYNPNAHPALKKALEDRIAQQCWWGKWAFWLALLALLIGLITLWRRSRHALCAAVGYQTTAVVHPVVPGAGGAAFVPAGFGPPLRNNTGIQHIS